MGRTTKVVDIASGHRTKAEKKARTKVENKIKNIDNSKLKPPSWLDDEAKKEFKRIVKEMQGVELLENLLSNLDLVTIAIYCNAYTNYKNATLKIQTEGTTIEHTNKAGETNTVVHPSVHVQTKYIEVIMKCSTKLGLSINDRMKLIIPASQQENSNKFEKFMR